MSINNKNVYEIHITIILFCISIYNLESTAHTHIHKCMLYLSSYKIYLRFCTAHIYIYDMMMMMNENIEWLRIGGVIVCSCCADASYVHKGIYDITLL